MIAGWALRRRCKARLQELAVPTALDLDTFIAEVVTRRPRPLSLLPMQLMGKPYGVWFTDGETERIWYERDTTPMHQRHIILHELSHLLCGHQPLDVTTFDGPFPDLDHGRIRVIMERSSYTRKEEREAETMASMLVERSATGFRESGMDTYSQQLLRVLGVSIGAWSGR